MNIILQSLSFNNNKEKKRMENEEKYNRSFYFHLCCFWLYCFCLLRSSVLSVRRLHQFATLSITNPRIQFILYSKHFHFQFRFAAYSCQWWLFFCSPHSYSQYECNCRVHQSTYEYQIRISFGHRMVLLHFSILSWYLNYLILASIYLFTNLIVRLNGMQLKLITSQIIIIIQIIWMSQWLIPFPFFLFSHSLVPL